MPVLELARNFIGNEGTSAFVGRSFPASFFERAESKSPFAGQDVNGQGMNGLCRERDREDSQALIRAFDIVVSLIVIAVFLPLLLLLALLVGLASPGPVLFWQQRVGRGGALFPCLKFRTMVVDAQAQLDRLLAESPEAREEWARDQKLRNDPRITWIGQILRKSSLDELPQLFNILVGQMSFVGPRPIVENEIVRYGSRFQNYCSVRPGLTGLWQISGRNDVSYAMRVRLDSLYAQRQSLTLNIGICFRTIPALMGSRGCY